MSYGDIKKLREDWKRRTLHGLYSREQVDWRRFKSAKARDERREEDGTPALPLQSRLEGMWVVGLPGTGKTQLFQYLLCRDLDLVAEGRASIIVLDPTGDEPGTLINNLSRLKRFAPGGDLYGKLIYIDPLDSGHTLPINLLSLRADLNNDEAVSSAIGSYVSIMGGLMGQHLTQFQDPVFRYAVQVALAFPNPTLETLRSIITPDTGRPPQPNLYWTAVYDQLHPRVRRYMETSFPTRSLQRTEILNRLDTLSSDPIFRRIFEGEETKLDIGAKINDANVIIINADRLKLGSLKELYGRYFLGLIKAAGERRPAHSIPCFIYVDECDEFVAYDSNVADIIFKLRRKGMALILGNQDVERIKTPRTAFLGTAIKMVNADDDSAAELAKNMKLPADRRSELVGRQTFDFAYYIRGKMDSPESFAFPPGVMEAQPRMSDEEWGQVLHEMRERYYVPLVRTNADPPSVRAPESKRVYAAADNPVDETAPYKPPELEPTKTTEAGRWSG